MEFDMQAETDGWVALGFSEDTQMVRAVHAYAHFFKRSILIFICLQTSAHVKCHYNSNHNCYQYNLSLFDTCTCRDIH